jgi:hypothetical protein
MSGQRPCIGGAAVIVMIIFMALAMMGSEATFIAAQTFFQPVGSLINAHIGFVAPPFRVQGNAAADMQGAIGTIARAFVIDDDMAGNGAADIFFGTILDALQHMTAHGFANIKIFS